jgi:folate-binding protein YgfZ
MTVLRWVGDGHSPVTNQKSRRAGTPKLCSRFPIESGDCFRAENGASRNRGNERRNHSMINSYRSCGVIHNGVTAVSCRALNFPRTVPGGIHRTRVEMISMSELLNHISEQALSDYDRLRDDCGLIELGAWSLLEMTGDDRKGWLQGQVSNDLRRFENGASISFCVCAPTGQLQCPVDGWALSDRFAFTCDAGSEGGLLERVAHMVILEDVVAENVTKKYKVFSLQGPSASKRLSEFTELPNLDAGEGTIDDVPVRLFRSNRTGLGGWDIWFPATRRKIAETLRNAVAPVNGEAYQAARLEAGIPVFGRDWDRRTLPPELGPAFENKHISYSKGCYTGQEVLMRMHSRGHTNRTWVGLVAESPLEEGAKVKHPARLDAGVVTSVAFSPDYGPIAAAMLRNEIAEDKEEVRVLTSRGEVVAEVRRMPIMRLT